MFYVHDVRMPVQPAVPVVHAPQAGATATNTGKAEEDPRLQWGARAVDGRSGSYTDLDRALIRAVTGEDVELLPDAELSPFALHILTDRRHHRLTPGHEIDLDYLARSHRRLSGLGAANPFSGDQLQRAVDFVRSRSEGRLDVVM
ncbi:MAG: hypothetical protein Q4G43_11385 [Mobilicoccus sp.]|nr:hypothetical protein [Mobilicoccus sp.]